MWTSHVTVATVVERDGKFLMVKEKDGDQIVYNQPAGHLDPGEDIISAAIRETLEETAWRVDIIGFLGIAQYSPNAEHTYLRSSFIAHPLEQTNQALDADIIQAEWLSHDELKAMRDQLRSPLVLATIEQYLSGNHYPLDAVYTPS